jgi:hypothetical protein
VYEHRGNGEHPVSLERRRQVLLWRSLAVLIVVGGAVVYQVVLLTLTGVVGPLAVVRLRALRRR